MGNCCEPTKPRYESLKQKPVKESKPLDVYIDARNAWDSTDGSVSYIVSTIEGKKTFKLYNRNPNYVKVFMTLKVKHAYTLFVSISNEIEDSYLIQFYTASVEIGGIADFSRESDTKTKYSLVLTKQPIIVHSKYIQLLIDSSKIGSLKIGTLYKLKFRLGARDYATYLIMEACPVSQAKAVS